METQVLSSCSETHQEERQECHKPIKPNCENDHFSIDNICEVFWLQKTIKNMMAVGKIKVWKAKNKIKAHGKKQVSTINISEMSRHLPALPDRFLGMESHMNKSSFYFNTMGAPVSRGHNAGEI